MKINSRSPFVKSLIFSLTGLLIFSFALAIRTVQAQFTESQSPASASVNRERGLSMLADIKDVIKQLYYDKNFRGVNIDERFKSAAEQIKKSGENNQIFSIIAQVLLEFNDSHTIFYPPQRFNRVEYGFSMQMIGSRCFIVQIKKGSDAEAKGLKTGDEILRIGSYKLTRNSLWMLEYFMYTLHPQQAVDLQVMSPDQPKTRDVTVNAKFYTPEERKQAAERKSKAGQKPYKCRELDAQLIACKLYSFSVEKSVIDQMMKEIGLHRQLILDLRGNGGGYIETEKHLIGYFFDRDIKIGEEVARKGTKQLIAKSLSQKAFRGELSVLIDSDSASASEIFARVIQLEKRGKIIGDRSAGKVMISNFLRILNLIGVQGNTRTVFGVNVTVSDLIMSDGQRLENIGVVPDEPVGPTGEALAAKTDPILAYAANLFGNKISLEKAGDLYFLTEKPEGEKEVEEKKKEVDN